MKSDLRVTLPVWFSLKYFLADSVALSSGCLDDQADLELHYGIMALDKYCVWWNKLLNCTLNGACMLFINSIVTNLLEGSPLFNFENISK